MCPSESRAVTTAMDEPFANMAHVAARGKKIFLILAKNSA
jgi:hypothetical protein